MEKIFSCVFNSKKTAIAANGEKMGEVQHTVVVKSRFASGAADLASNELKFWEPENFELFKNPTVIEVEDNQAYIDYMASKEQVGQLSVDLEVEEEKPMFFQDIINSLIAHNCFSDDFDSSDVDIFTQKLESIGVNVSEKAGEMFAGSQFTSPMTMFKYFNNDAQLREDLKSFDEAAKRLENSVETKEEVKEESSDRSVINYSVPIGESNAVFSIKFDNGKFTQSCAVKLGPDTYGRIGVFGNEFSTKLNAINSACGILIDHYFAINKKSLTDAAVKILSEIAKNGDVEQYVVEPEVKAEPEAEELAEHKAENKPALAQERLWMHQVTPSMLLCVLAKEQTTDSVENVQAHLYVAGMGDVITANRMTNTLAESVSNAIAEIGLKIKNTPVQKSFIDDFSSFQRGFDVNGLISSPVSDEESVSDAVESTLSNYEPDNQDADYSTEVGHVAEEDINQDVHPDDVNQDFEQDVQIAESKVIPEFAVIYPSENIAIFADLEPSFDCSVKIFYKGFMFADKHAVCGSRDEALYEISALSLDALDDAMEAVASHLVEDFAKAIEGMENAGEKWFESEECKTVNCAAYNSIIDEQKSLECVDIFAIEEIENAECSVDSANITTDSTSDPSNAADAERDTVTNTDELRDPDAAIVKPQPESSNVNEASEESGNDSATHEAAEKASDNNDLLNIDSMLKTLSKFDGVTSADIREVCESDEFEIEFGPHKVEYKHVIKSPFNRGTVLGYYLDVRTSSGAFFDTIAVQDRESDSTRELIVEIMEKLGC